MPDNVNITVNETIENIVINPSISTEVIDVNITGTTETVNIDVTPNLTTVNINSISGSPVTKTSDLINDGEDGINPFITAQDVPAQGLTSVGLSMPVAFNVSNSPLTSDGTIAVSAAGTASQYIRGDGQLATLPSGGGGGSSVNYYLNGSIAASVATYKQMSNTAIIGAGTDFTLTGNGLISQFLTDFGNPNRTEIPGGAWNFEMFFSMSSNGGTPAFYVQLLKYDGATFTSIASSSAVPENITGGTSIDLYLTSLAVPTTPLLITDRLAIRVYIVNNSGGRTATLHTENSNLCEIITTFSGGVTSLNGLTTNTQYLAVGTTGTDFNINSLVDTHTFNLPTASATNRGALSTTDWSAFNSKFTLPSLTSGSVLFSNGTTIAQKNSNFFWDNTNNRLGIGTNTPTSALNILDTKTATINNQIGALNILGTFTARATISDSLTSFQNSQILVASANTQKLVGTTLKTTYNLGAFTGITTFPLEIYGTNNEGLFRIKTSSNGNENKIILGDWLNGGFASKLVFLRPSGASEATTMIQGNSVFAVDNVNGPICFNAYANTSNVLINSITDNGGKLQIKAPGALSTDIALRVRNSADTADLLSLDGTSKLVLNSTTTLAIVSIFSSGNASRLQFQSTAYNNIQANGTVPFYFDFAENLNFRGSVGASQIMRLVGATSNVLINTTTDNGGKLQIKAPGALSTDIALRVRNSADTADLMNVSGSGNISFKTTNSNTNGTILFTNNNSVATIAATTDTGSALTMLQFRGNGYNFTDLGTNGFVIQSTGYGTSATPSAILQVDSTTKGFLPPRMTTTQKNAIATPASGLVVYDTTLNKLCVRGASAWETITSI